MAYFGRRVPDLTKFRASKLLFFADKYHLTRYGRPVIGDTYARMDHGPVPSQSYNYMNDLVSSVGFPRHARPHIDRLSYFLDVDTRPEYPSFVSKRDPDLAVLSESDLEALEFAVHKYGKLSTSRLWRAAHDDPAWKNTADHWIDYEQFFDQADPQQRAVLELAREHQENDALLDSLMASDRLLSAN